jgi:broad specificity phosphatase PhoE
VPQPVRQILLVRHGRPSCPIHNDPLTLSQFHAWIDTYNLAGLAPDSPPPPDLIDRARTIQCIVSSDLPRASESAHRLAPHAHARTSALYREAGRPLPCWDPKRSATLSAWDRLSVQAWRNNRIQTDESLDRAIARAREAAQELTTLAAEFTTVLCVAHGTFNALLASQLLRLNWLGPQTPADEHWGATTYTHNG